MLKLIIEFDELNASSYSIFLTGKTAIPNLVDKKCFKHYNKYSCGSKTGQWRIGHLRDTVGVF